MKHFLVTGGAGYIGSHFVLNALKKGYEVSVIDNFSNSNNKNLKRIEKITNKKINFYKLDLRKSLQEVDEKDIDTIFHFAALKSVNESVLNPLLYYKNNVGGTLNLLEWALKNKIKNFVFSSTAAVYGNSKKPLKESDRLNPESVYAKSKLMIEESLKDISKSNDISVCIFRYFNVAGNIETGKIGDLQKNPQNLIPAMIMSHLGIKKINFKVFGSDYNTKDGTGVRDYIHVNDLILAHFKGYKYIQQNKGFHIFNLGTGTGTSVLEIIKAFEKITNKKIKYEIAGRREGDVGSSTCDYTKAKKELKCEPVRTIKDMIVSSLKWYKDYFQ